MNPGTAKLIFASLVAAILLVVGLVAGNSGEERAQSVTVSSAFHAVDALPSVEPGQSGDEEEVAEDADEEPAEQVPAPVPDPPKVKTAPKSPPRQPAKQRQFKASVLQIVTNFDKADVTVNGLKYPEYFEPGQPEGMVLPAGGPYTVLVKFDGKTKEYRLNLRPYETRLLLVELSGYQDGAPPAPAPAKKVQQKKEQKKEAPQKKADNKAPGRITVYSKPGGTVIVDGNATGEKTPGTVELENGRHEVQVQYESGGISEKKIVRVRTGSRIKLFFRERKGN